MQVDVDMSLYISGETVLMPCVHLVPVETWHVGAASLVEGVGILVPSGDAVSGARRRCRTDLHQSGQIWQEAGQAFAHRVLVRRANVGGKTPQSSLVIAAD